MIVAIIMVIIMIVSIAFYFSIASQASKYSLKRESSDIPSPKRPLYAKDPEYEEAIIREADYFKNNPDEWPGYGH